MNLLASRDGILRLLIIISARPRAVVVFDLLI